MNLNSLHVERISLLNYHAGCFSGLFGRTEIFSNLPRSHCHHHPTNCRVQEAFLMPPGMYQRSTQSSTFHQGLGSRLSPRRNQFTKTAMVGTEQPSLYCTIYKKKRKSRGRNKTAGSQFHLVELWHSLEFMTSGGLALLTSQISRRKATKGRSQALP